MQTITHPEWATHAMMGFESSQECRDHADANSPDKDYGMRYWTGPGETDVMWEWYWPKEKLNNDIQHQRMQPVP